MHSERLYIRVKIGCECFTWLIKFTHLTVEVSYQQS